MALALGTLLALLKRKLREPTGEQHRWPNKNNREQAPARPIKPLAREPASRKAREAKREASEREEKGEC